MYFVQDFFMKWTKKRPLLFITILLTGHCALDVTPQRQKDDENDEKKHNCATKDDPYFNEDQ